VIGILANFSFFLICPMTGRELDAEGAGCCPHHAIAYKRVPPKQLHVKN